MLLNGESGFVGDILDAVVIVMFMAVLVRYMIMYATCVSVRGLTKSLGRIQLEHRK